MATAADVVPGDTVDIDMAGIPFQGMVQSAEWDGNVVDIVLVAGSGVRLFGDYPVDIVHAPDDEVEIR